MTNLSHALMLDVDRPTITAHLDRVRPWLATTRTLQATFGKALQDTADDVSEPHIRTWLHQIAETARKHEDAVDDLYRAFGHDPDSSVGLASVTSTVLGTARELVGEVQGLVAGAHGRAWRKMRMLLLTGLDSMSGFAVTEQLGLALGRPAAVNIAFPIVAKKSRDQLLIRECFLEMAANAILYRRDV